MPSSEYAGAQISYNVDWVGDSPGESLHVTGVVLKTSGLETVLDFTCRAEVLWGLAEILRDFWKQYSEEK